MDRIGRGLWGVLMGGFESLDEDGGYLEREWKWSL